MTSPRSTPFLLKSIFFVALTLLPNVKAFVPPSPPQPSCLTRALRTVSATETAPTTTTALAATTTEENDIFLPLKRFFGGNGDKKQEISGPVNDYDDAIAEAKTILKRAAETRKEDPDEVYAALENLEKLMRKKCKAEPETAASEVLTNLNGAWQLVFTTGTKDTQKKIGAKINYFPIKAVQSFDTSVDPMQIRNGIYLGDFNVIKFFGDFEFDLKKSKLEFDFDKIAVFGFEINLGKGKAAEIGAATGLGSDNNKQLIEKKKKPFFNWISADDNIATARGGGGGLALWERIDDE